MKNIIPAIASTNAIIAASCCNEAMKIATNTAPSLGFEENYMMYTGDEAIYTHVFRNERKADCPVCGSDARPLTVDPDWTLRELLDSFAVKADLQLKKPSITAQNKTLYMQAPPSIEEQTRPNLDKKLRDDLGLQHGQEIAVTDPAFPSLIFTFYLQFS